MQWICCSFRGERRRKVLCENGELLSSDHGQISGVHSQGGEMEPDCAKIARIPFGEGERGVVGFFFNFGNVDNVILRKYEY